jgi:hypothetical protein
MAYLRTKVTITRERRATTVQMKRQSFFSRIVRNFDQLPLPGSCIPAHNVFGFPHRKPNRRSVANVEKTKSRNSSLGLLRATVFRHFLGFLGLHGTSRHFMWRGLKPRGTKGDGGIFPCKTRLSKSLEFKSPLSAIVYFTNKIASV